MEAFCRSLGNPDQSLDALRIESAFVKFERTGKKWPSPADVIDLMPRRPEQRKLEEPRQDLPKAFKQIAEGLSNGSFTRAQWYRLLVQMKKENPVANFDPEDYLMMLKRQGNTRHIDMDAPVGTGIGNEIY